MLGDLNQMGKQGSTLYLVKLIISDDLQYSSQKGPDLRLAKGPNLSKPGVIGHIKAGQNKSNCWQKFRFPAPSPPPLWSVYAAMLDL